MIAHSRCSRDFSSKVATGRRVLSYDFSRSSERGGVGTKMLRMAQWDVRLAVAVIVRQSVMMYYVAGGWYRVAARRFVQ